MPRAIVFLGTPVFWRLIRVKSNIIRSHHNRYVVDIYRIITCIERFRSRSLWLFHIFPSRMPRFSFLATDGHEVYPTQSRREEERSKEWSYREVWVCRVGGKPMSNSRWIVEISVVSLWTVVNRWITMKSLDSYTAKPAMFGFLYGTV